MKEDKLNIYIQYNGFIKIGEIFYREKKDYVFKLNKKHENICNQIGLFDNENVFNFFDALLPEESERRFYARKINVEFDDTWNLIKNYGLDSIGCFVISEKEEKEINEKLNNINEDDVYISKEELLNKINNEKLDYIINNKMSIAGAQNKILLNYYQEHDIYKIPNIYKISNFILKPEIKNSDLYPLATINEFYCMSLAKEIGLNVPDNYIKFIPEPIYLIKRFDRDLNGLIRIPIKDATQVLNIPKENKYIEANVENLLKFTNHININKLNEKEQLAKWLIFNFFIGNCDNHLKNISLIYNYKFDKNIFEIRLAPFYDMLSTTIYASPVFQNNYFSNDKNINSWQNSQLCVPINNKNFINDVDYEDLIKMIKSIGFKDKKSQTILDDMINSIKLKMFLVEEKVIKLIDNEKYKSSAIRMIKGINHTIIKNNIYQIEKSKLKNNKKENIKMKMKM